jgi:hypothetical protein
MQLLFYTRRDILPLVVTQRSEQFLEFGGGKNTGIIQINCDVV